MYGYFLRFIFLQVNSGGDINSGSPELDRSRFGSVTSLSSHHMVRYTFDAAQCHSIFEDISMLVSVWLDEWQLDEPVQCGGFRGCCGIRTDSVLTAV